MSGTTTRDPWAGFEEVTPTKKVDPWAAFEEVKGAEPAPPSTAGSIGRNFLRGLTFNAADEIASGITATARAVKGDPGTWGQNYGQALDENRAIDRRFDKDNPKASMAAQVAGTIANPITWLGGPASTLVGTIAKGAAIGAGTGAVSGFNEGEGGLGPRLGAALTGGVTGGVLGGAIPLVGAGLAKGARVVGGWMGLNNAATNAQRDLVQALKTDFQNGGDSLPDIASRLKNAPTNQPLILPDVASGEATMGLAQAVSREPGMGRSMAKATIDSRGGLNQSGRLADAVKTGISADDFLATKDALIASRAAAGKPAYDMALAVDKPVNSAPIVAQIDARIETAKGPVKDALRKARAVLLNKDGAPDTTMAGLHESKLALDALLDRSAPKPIDRVARSEVIDVQKSLLAAMDEASDGLYANARQAWAGPSRAMDAMDLGKRVLVGDVDETAAEIAKLSPSEKDMFRIGVSRALIDRVKNTGDTKDITKINSIWGNEGTRERIAAAFDDPKKFEEFSAFMQREMDMARTNAVINPRGGSQTSPIQAQRGQPPAMGPALSALASGIRGDTLGAGMHTLRAFNAGAPDVTARFAEMAPYLFTMKAGDRARLIDQLMARETTDAGRERLGRAIANALRQGGVSAGVQIEN